MANLGLIIIILLIIPFLLLFFRNKNGLPTNWPVVGMLPALLLNANRCVDFFTEIMEKSHLSFHIKGPWLLNMDFLYTVHPSNMNHVLNKNFPNYIKGHKLNEMLEALGDGIFNSDFDVWLYHRNHALSFLNHPSFHQNLLQTSWNKLENGLIPILDHASKNEIEIDLQDVFLRLMYDTMSIIMMDHDPLSLSMNLPNFPLIKAVADLEHAVVYRHVLPTCVWKLLRWLNLGQEKTYKLSWKIVDDFIYKCIHKKRIKLRDQKYYQDHNVDLLTLFLNEDDDKKASSIGHQCKDKFLRDTITNFYLAGPATITAVLSWFFYLLSKNPRVVHRIKEELNAFKILRKENDDFILKNFKEISEKLVYLHATVYETLRLYPGVAFNIKTAIESDILPSGHKVNQNTQIIFNMYAMGRMKDIWGDDCNDFIPERWILDGGTIKHEPSYKFSAFGSGQRTCVGKQMAITQIKIVAAFIIRDYHIEAIDNNLVPVAGLLPRIKHGFKVKVFRDK
ncbi:unnamed protein product [Amaranthus hypochondriacus]